MREGCPGTKMARQGVVIKTGQPSDNRIQIGFGTPLSLNLGEVKRVDGRKTGRKDPVRA
jgi:hypothetical protein